MTSIRHRARSLTIAGVAALAGLGTAYAQMATFVTDDFDTHQVGSNPTGGTITPGYSRNHTVWTVDEGPVATNGASVGNYRPAAGSLNFGCAGNPTVTLPFGPVDEGPASIEFTLRQSNAGRGSYLFDLTVRDTAGKAYTIHMSPHPGYFGTSGFAILDNPPYAGGLPGAALTTDSQTLRLDFDPATGFALRSSAYPDGPVLSFANVHHSEALQSATFRSRDAGGTWMSWFLDDVTVRADERTADETARAEAEAAARAAGAARHEAFRREHHVRSPHPQWFSSLRPGADGGPALVLADDYQARHAILLPAEPSAQETQAAAELAFWLKMLSGAEFSVVKDGEQALPGHVISLGRTSAAKDANLEPVDLKDDGYRIAVVTDNLLLGGGRRTGILNAVYSLLEEDLGCRWYQPGNDGTVIPMRVKLSLQPAPRVFVSPFDKMRWVDYGDVADGDWQRRNRTRPGAWANPHFVHTYYQHVPSELFAEHPEYFALQSGKRGTGQICPSHPEVREMTLRNVRKYLAARPDADFVDISPNDGGGACQCPLCQAIIDREGGTDMGPLLELVNYVADRIAGEYPQVRVTTLAYLNTVVPPKTFGPSPNVVPWLATDAHSWGFGDLFVWETERSSRAMQQWHDVWQASTIVWDYPSHFGFSPYNLNLPVIADNLKWYAARGAVGIYFQTQHNENHGFPQSYQRSWVFAKLGWDPARNTRDLVRDFNYGFYGAAAPPMQAFDELLWGTWEEWYGARVSGTTRPWTPDQIREEKLPGRVELDQPFWQKAEELLLAADAAVADAPDQRQRVAVARLPMMYRQLEQGPPDPKAPAAYLARVDEFEAIARRASIQYIEGMVGPHVPGGTLQPKLDYWRKLAAPPAEIPYIELDNTWRFMPDPGNRGTEERWFAPEYADLAWGSVKTGNWTTQGFAGGQPAWYRQSFTVTDEMLAREALWMLFGAVDETAEIYINGKLAFEHTVEATGLSVDTLWNKAFVFDARPFVQAGANSLAVRVTDTRGAAGIWIPVRFVPGKEKPDAQVLTDRIEELVKIRAVLRREQQ